MIIFLFLLHPNLDLVIVSLTTCDKSKSNFLKKPCNDITVDKVMHFTSIRSDFDSLPRLVRY